MRIRVETIDGHGGEREPAAFTLGERRFVVLELLDRWPAATRMHFKLRVDDGRVFVVRHDLATGDWELAALVRSDLPPPHPAAH